MQDEQPSLPPENSPAETTYDEIRSLMKLLGITYGAWVEDDVLAVRAEYPAKKRHLDWKVAIPPLSYDPADDYWHPTRYSDGSLARCGAVPVWLWAIGVLVEPDGVVCKDLLRTAPVMPDERAGRSAHATPESGPPIAIDLPTVGPTIRSGPVGVRRKRSRSVASGRRLDNGHPRDQCDTQSEF